jgi:hypothetical protein
MLSSRVVSFMSKWFAASKLTLNLDKIYQEEGIFGIIVGAKPQTYCGDIFKKLQVLHLPCNYIFSSINFIINNLEHFQTNPAVHC